MARPQQCATKFLTQVILDKKAGGQSIKLLVTHSQSTYLTLCG